VLGWLKKKVVNNKKEEEDVGTFILKGIKEAHTISLGTTNNYRQWHEKHLNLQQLVVANGKKIIQHLVKIYIGSVLLMRADYTDIDTPIFYEITDNQLITIENQTIDFYISQI